MEFFDVPAAAAVHLAAGHASAPSQVDSYVVFNVVVEHVGDRWVVQVHGVWQDEGRVLRSASSVVPLRMLLDTAAADGDGGGHAVGKDSVVVRPSPGRWGRGSCGVMDVSMGSVAPTDDDRARAVGTVLGSAADAGDAMLLLQILDLSTKDVARYAAQVGQIDGAR